MRIELSSGETIHLDFYYFYEFDKDGHDVRGVEALISDEEGRTTSATAICSFLDQFVKETGRQIALKRLVATMPRKIRGEILSAYFNRKKRERRPSPTAGLPVTRYYLIDSHELEKAVAKYHDHPQLVDFSEFERELADSIIRGIENGERETSTVPSA